MKKVLLFAAASIVCGSVMAQSVSSQKMGRAAKMSNPAVQSAISGASVSRVDQSQVKAVSPAQMGVPQLNLSSSSAMLQVAAGSAKKAPFAISSIKSAVSAPVSKVVASTSALAPTYYASAYNANDEYLEWTVRTGLSNDTTYFENLVLLSEDLPLTYYSFVNGNTITIPCNQYLESITIQGETGAYDLFFRAGKTQYEDGKLTIAADGSLSTDQAFFIFVQPMASDGTHVFNQETSLGYMEAVAAPAYATTYVAVAPSFDVQADNLVLNAIFSADYYALTNAYYGICGANNSVAFSCQTTGNIASYNWSMPIYDNATQTIADYEVSTDDQLTVQTGIGTYGYPSLTCTKSGLDSTAVLGSRRDNFDLKGKGIMFAGYCGDWLQNAGTTFEVSRANLDNGFARYSSVYPTGGITVTNQASKLYCYQGKPSGPVYFEGVDIFMYQFAATDPTAEITLVIRECTNTVEDGLTLGDTIAMASATSANFEATAGTLGVLHFEDFFVEDEDGLSESLDYIQTNKEFILEFDGWDNKSISAVPYGEYYCDAAGLYNTFFEMASQPGKIYHYTTGGQANLCIGLVGGTYGYLNTESETNIVAPTTGGSFTLDINPMLTGQDENGNSKTGMWLGSESDDPDALSWLSLSIPHESYTETDWGFTLQIDVDALPAGVTGRAAHLVFEQWGAELVIEVKQGDATGLSDVKIASKLYKATVSGDNIIVSCPTDVESVNLYNAAGALTSTVAVKNGKAVISGASKGLNIVNFGGKQSVKVMK